MTRYDVEGYGCRDFVLICDRNSPDAYRDFRIIASFAVTVQERSTIKLAELEWSAKKAAHKFRGLHYFHTARATLIQDLTGVRCVREDVLIGSRPDDHARLKI